MHSGSLALGGPQTDSSSVRGGRLASKAAPEPNTDRRNLRGRGSQELGPVGPNMQARVSPRPRLGILAKRTGLIAQEAPPRLGWPSAWCRQIARDGGLGNCVPEHEKLTMDPWSTPEKVLTGHSCDQNTDLTGNPRTSTSPAATRSISPKPRPALTAPTQHRIGLNDHQAFAPLRPPARQQDPKQPINATEVRAPSSAALQHGDLVPQRDRLQQQRGAGSGLALGDRDRSAGRRGHEGRLSPQE